MFTKLCVCTESITCPWFFKETCHLHCIISLLWCGAGVGHFSWCYTPRLSTWRLNLFFFFFVKAVTGSTLLTRTRATFWGGQYFDRFAIDQWISIFSAFNMGTMGGKKAIRELYRYGVTGCVPAGGTLHWLTRQPHTHTVAVVCVAVKGVRQKLLCR